MGIALFGEVKTPTHVLREQRTRLVRLCRDVEGAIKHEERAAGEAYVRAANATRSGHPEMARLHGEQSIVHERAACRLQVQYGKVSAMATSVFSLGIDAQMLDSMIHVSRALRRISARTNNTEFRKQTEQFARETEQLASTVEIVNEAMEGADDARDDAGVAAERGDIDTAVDNMMAEMEAEMLYPKVPSASERVGVHAAPRTVKNRV